MITFLRALSRMLAFVFLTSVYILFASLASLIRGQQLARNLRWRKILVEALIKMLGVEIRWEGSIPQPPGLIVSNHRSYFDPVALFQQTPALAVGKSEVGSWPIIGYIAKITGTIFVRRASIDGRRAAAQMIVETIKQGQLIINFPEGTTHVKPHTIAFKRGAFIMAAKNQLSVTPMAIDYEDPEDAWVGDDTFIRHFFQCFGKKRTRIKITFGQRLLSDDPNDLLQSSKNWIDAQLLRFKKEWTSS